MEREIVFVDPTRIDSYKDAAWDALNWVQNADNGNEVHGDFIASDKGTIFRAFELHRLRTRGKQVTQERAVSRFIQRGLVNHVNISVMAGINPHPNGPRVVAFYLNDKELDLLERWLCRTMAFVGDVEASELRIYTTSKACPEAWYRYYNPKVASDTPDDFSLVPYRNQISEEFCPPDVLLSSLRTAAHENGLNADLGLHGENIDNLKDVLKRSNREISLLTEAELAQICYDAGLTFGDAGWLIGRR